MSAELRQECIEVIDALLEIIALDGAGAYPHEWDSLARAEKLLKELKQS